MALPYDKTDARSIETYAKRLIGHSLSDVIDESDLKKIVVDSNNKGDLGRLTERYFFKYEPNNFKAPDFKEAGLELKVTPVLRKKGSLRSKERLVLNIINYFDESSRTWENSSFWKKNRSLLILFYLHENGIPVKDLLFQLIGRYDFPPEDLVIIRQDWETIVGMIRHGKAHELSERSTLYLAACRKGRGHDGDLRDQPNSDIKAPQRAFSLKQGYMNIILDRWTSGPASEDIQPILKPDELISGEKDFYERIIEKISPYYGWTIERIRNKFEINISPKAKNYYAILTYRMLGIRSSKAEEFEKAGIIIRSVRLSSNNMPEESTSLPVFKYKEIIYEKWDSSTLRSYLNNQFFFVFYKYNENHQLELNKAVFWSMPYADLEVEVKGTWMRTVEQIRNGHAEDLPGIRDTRICHVRPHARDSKDTYDTPDGRKLVKCSFWLNADYIKSIYKVDVTNSSLRSLVQGKFEFRT